MAVYKRTYKAYTGPLTNPTWRFLVLQRYALKSIFKSRFLLVGYLACFIAPILAICLVYLNQNASILAQIHQKPGLLTINGSWFGNFLSFQGLLAGLVTAFVGPSLVAPDLTNGALSVYLSRPFSRAEYILGKGAVLGALIASITLIPALLLFAVQSSLSGWTWFTDNIFIAGGTLAICILMTALLHPPRPRHVGFRPLAHSSRSPRTSRLRSRQRLRSRSQRHHARRPRLLPRPPAPAQRHRPVTTSSRPRRRVEPISPPSGLVHHSDRLRPASPAPESKAKSLRGSRLTPPPSPLPLPPPPTPPPPIQPHP